MAEHEGKQAKADRVPQGPVRTTALLGAPPDMHTDGVSSGEVLDRFVETFYFPT